MKKWMAGFTIIEIMIVVAIIGLLAAIAVPNFIQARKQSQAQQFINAVNPVHVEDAHASGQDYAETSRSGVTAVRTQVKPGADGLTVEQRNVAARLGMDNKVGSIKHLYVISAYSGQVLIYSTVKGKVTSSGKRLTPTTVAASDGSSYGGIPININGSTFRTGEVLQDDGTYGSSAEYIYWWDTRGIYHQHYISGGQIVHISDQPVAVKNIVINMEAVEPEKVAA